MKLDIVNIKKSQLSASKDASVATMEAPTKKQVKKPKADYSGVPEAEAQKDAVKTEKRTSATKVRSTRKVIEKKSETKKIEVVNQKAIKPKKEKEPVKLTTPKFQLVHYSEKSIALFGDTKPIKEELKALGGRFNSNLRPFGEDNRVPGWVFPKKVEEDLKKLIG